MLKGAVMIVTERDSIINVVKSSWQLVVMLTVQCCIQHSAASLSNLIGQKELICFLMLIKHAPGVIS